MRTPLDKILTDTIRVDVRSNGNFASQGIAQTIYLPNSYITNPTESLSGSFQINVNTQVRLFTKNEIKLPLKSIVYNDRTKQYFATRGQVLQFHPRTKEFLVTEIYLDFIGDYE